MLDVGFWEVALLLVLALLILGPERLPRAARVVGFWLGRARGAYYSMRTELDREFQLQEMRKAGRDFSDELSSTLNRDRPDPAEPEAPPADDNARTKP